MLDAAAAMVLLEASRAEQRKLALALDDLRTTPFRTGDLQESDALGRVHEVLVLGDWLVTYWPDHAARELRIVSFEQAED